MILRLVAAGSALALAAGLAGCSTERDMETWREPGPTEASSSEPSTGAEPTTTEPLLELTSSTIEGESCTSSPVRDHAWFEVQFEVLADLQEFAFELVDPDGVRQVGDGLVVPPVNFGGRIDYSGSATWSGRADIGNAREVSWIERSPVPDWVPAEGQTGLVVLHLRFDGSPASISGVRATWTDEDGTTGESVVDLPQTWRFVGDAADCD